jgi:hypothetical protein
MEGACSRHSGVRCSCRPGCNSRSSGFQSPIRWLTAAEPNLRHLLSCVGLLWSTSSRACRCCWSARLSGLNFQAQRRCGNTPSTCPSSPFASADALGFPALPSPPMLRKLEACKTSEPLVSCCILPCGPHWALSRSCSRPVLLASDPEVTSSLISPAFPPLPNALGCVGLLQRSDCHAHTMIGTTAGLSHHPVISVIVSLARLDWCPTHLQMCFGR